MGITYYSGKLHKLGDEFEAKLWAKITSVTSGHNVTCF